MEQIAEFKYRRKTEIIKQKLNEDVHASAVGDNEGPCRR